jgi:hypothetical protein
MLQWTHLQLLHATAAGPTCMHVGVERARVVARETVRVQIDTERARDMEQHGTPREAGMRRGPPNASPHLDVPALAFPNSK